MAKRILEQVVASETIRPSVGAAKQLDRIERHEPAGIVVMLKHSNADLKKNLERYIKAGDHELIKMARIGEWQQKLLGLISDGILSLGTAVSNHVLRGPGGGSGTSPQWGAGG